MVVRQIPLNFRNVTGINASRKSTSPAAFESTLERDFLTLLEFTEAVDHYQVQPLTIEWHDGSRQRSYTPDVLVVFNRRRAKPLLYEVKYRSELRARWAELHPKFRAAHRFARAQGWRFKLITEREIRTPYLLNARFLIPYVRRGPTSEADMTLLARTLDTLREASASELLHAACLDEWNRARLLPCLWYLVGTRAIHADLHRPLTMATRVWNPPEA